jgi:hypothetical protein
MATERRRQLLLGAVVVVLATILYRMWPGTSAVPAAASNPRGTGSVATQPQPGAAGPAQATQGTKGSTTAPVVRLDDLNADRPTPGGNDRDLFRFKPKAPPPPPPPASTRPTQPIAPVNPAPQPPPGPPPLPPITLKFIGIMESPSTGQKIAALSDGRNTFHGVEGAIIEGRYRILKIGVESIELAYVDGRGRQTIRLTGS